MRQRGLPLTAGLRQGAPARVRALQGRARKDGGVQLSPGARLMVPALLCIGRLAHVLLRGTARRRAGRARMAGSRRQAETGSRAFRPVSRSAPPVRTRPAASEGERPCLRQRATHVVRDLLPGHAAPPFARGRVRCFWFVPGQSTDRRVYLQDSGADLGSRPAPRVRIINPHPCPAAIPLAGWAWPKHTFAKPQKTLVHGVECPRRPPPWRGGPPGRPLFAEGRSCNG